MSSFAVTPPLDLSGEVPTIDFTRELATEAELQAPDGVLSEELKEHIVTLANTHLITSGQTRNDMWVLATSALFITDSLPDLELTPDDEVAAALYEGRTLARGRMYSVEHLSSVAFSGFGIRLFGVELRQPQRARPESLFVPVDSIALAIPAS